MRLRHLTLMGNVVLSLGVLPFGLQSQTPPATTPKPAPAAAVKPAVAGQAVKPATAATSPKPATAGAAPKPATPGAPAKPAVTGAGAAKPAVKAPAKPAPPKEMTDEQKTIYALGLSLARSIKPFDLSAAEIDLVHQALIDSVAKKPAVDIDTWGPKIQGLAETRGALVILPMPPALGTLREAPNRVSHSNLAWRLRDLFLPRWAVATVRAGYVCVIELSQG